MRVWILLLLATLTVSFGWAETPAAALIPTYSIIYKDAPGTERQYQGNFKADIEFHELLNGSSTGSFWASESWIARETVLSNENGKANLKFWVAEGTHSAQFPGRFTFVTLPTSITPGEPLHPYSLNYTRSANGTPTGIYVLGGRFPDEHCETPYAAFYAHLFSCGLDLKLPHPDLTIGEQWSDTVELALVTLKQQPGAMVTVKRNFTFLGPKVLEGKQYLALCADIDTGDLNGIVKGKAGSKRIYIDATLSISGKSTIYFDTEAGEIARVSIEGTCKTNTAVYANPKKKATESGWESTITKFSGQLKRVPVTPMPIVEDGNKK